MKTLIVPGVLLLFCGCGSHANHPRLPVDTAAEIRTPTATTDDETQGPKSSLAADSAAGNEGLSAVQIAWVLDHISLTEQQRQQLSEPSAAGDLAVAIDYAMLVTEGEGFVSGMALVPGLASIRTMYEWYQLLTLTRRLVLPLINDLQRMADAEQTAAAAVVSQSEQRLAQLLAALLQGAGTPQNSVTAEQNGQGATQLPPWSSLLKALLQ